MSKRSIAIETVNYLGHSSDRNFNAKVLYRKNGKLYLAHIDIDYFNKFKPYIFLGGSFVKAESKRTPTLNFGLGNSYWISERFGLKTQVIYKFSEKRFESMQSHFQFTLGVVYSFNIDHLFRRKSVCKTNGF